MGSKCPGEVVPMPACWNSVYRVSIAARLVPLMSLVQVAPTMFKLCGRLSLPDSVGTILLVSGLVSNSNIANSHLYLLMHLHFGSYARCETHTRPESDKGNGY